MPCIRQFIHCSILNLKTMWLYIFLSYFITLGMMIETYGKKRVPTEAYFMYVLSPIILPILIGMQLAENPKRDE